MRSRCSSLHRTLPSNTFSRRILQRRMRSLKYGSSIKPMALARLKSVAGVIIPDTALCNAAVELLESGSPGFLWTHCLRTYIFGSLAVRGLGRSVVDEEAAFCGAVLHDLGLVPPYRRDNRFEVDGADAARQFCSKHQVPPERADLVWKAIRVTVPFGTFTWSEKVLAPAEGLFVVPPSIDARTASMLNINPTTAVLLLDEFVKLKAKDWIVLNAANSHVARCLIAIAKSRDLKC